MPTAWYTVHLDSAPQGTLGNTLANITSGSLTIDSGYDPDGDGTAVVYADSAADAVRTALTGAVTVDLSAVNLPTTEYTFGLGTSTTATADPLPFLLTQLTLTSPPGDPDLGDWRVTLEDLASFADVSDWDYNDFSWDVTVAAGAAPATGPATEVHTSTYLWDNGGGTATVTVTVTQDKAGYEGLYHWNYHVVNNGWNIPPDPNSDGGIGMFILRVPETGGIANLQSSTGWQGHVGQLLGEPYTVHWMTEGEGGSRIFEGEAGDFSFTTPVTGIGDAIGEVYDASFAYGMGGGGKGPELQIKSVTLKPENGQGNLEKNPNVGGGVRIFPEKAKPGQNEPITDKVRVVVELSQAPVANTTVKMYQFDVDDPSATNTLADAEWIPLDNRGDTEQTSGSFTLTVAAGQTTAATTRTVSPRPGDNYRFVASLDAGTLGTDVRIRSQYRAVDASLPPWLGVDITTVTITPFYVDYRDGDRADVYHYNQQGALGAAVADKNARTVKSQLLTVWRKLHVERDVMDKPPPGEPFAGAGQKVNGPNQVGDVQGDDDVAPDGVGGKVKMPGIELMKTNYRAAYIEVTDDLGALNTKNPVFIHNLENDGNAFAANWGAIYAAKDVSSDDEAFWAIQLVGGYEGGAANDNDPAQLHAHLGYTGGRNAAVVYTETIRDSWVTTVAAAWANQPNPITQAILVERTAFHESLHTFAFVHDDDDFPFSDEGPLNPGTNGIGTVAENTLTPGQIDAIRRRDRPGNLGPR